MRRREISFCLISILAFLPACQFFENADFSNLPLGSTNEGTVGRVTPGLGTLDITSGSVRVLLVNGSGEEVDVRVTMRVAGERVHFSFQRMAADSKNTVVGPDRADTVVVEATLLTSPTQDLPIQSFVFGQDFQSGDTIRVLLGALPAPPPPPPPPPPSPTISIVGLDSDIVVDPGETVTFDVTVEEFSAAGLVRVFGDLDQDPNNGEQFIIRENVPAEDTIPVSWVVSDPGWYLVYAELLDGETFVRYGPAAGRVHVRENLPPQLVFDSPRDGQAVTSGHEFIIAWVGQDDHDEATITIFLDTNESYDEDGTEQVFRNDISAADVTDREHIVNTSALDLGLYYVGGRISDGVNQPVDVYAGQVLITNRLVGRFTPDELLDGEITTIAGGSDNHEFGADIDISRSLNPSAPPIEGDNLAEVLVSDPSAEREIVTGQFIIPGMVYLHWSDGIWPRNLTVDDLSARIIGANDGDEIGRRLALVENVAYVEGDFERDIVIGSTGYFEQFFEGAAYHFTNGPVDEDVYLTGRYHRLNGQTGDVAGWDVAALGDLDGDGASEFAVGALGDPNSWDTGRVYVIPGDTYITEYQTLGGAADIIFEGVDEGNLTGYAICGVDNVHSGDQLGDEIAIGAPAATSTMDDPNSDTGRPGTVYVVFGEVGMFSFDGKNYSLGNLGNSFDPNSLDGLIFVGENDGDFAGAALASGDFDADDKIDLLIGAPFYDGGRGRVYLIYDIGNPALPQAPNQIDLGLVGVSGGYDGAVFDGLAVGDLLGYNLAAADFDGDFADDPVLGAPGSESLRGAAYLVYGIAGSKRLFGNVDLTQIGLIDLLGWELVGYEGQIDQLGMSLSGGGDLDGDLIEDVGVGAPGDTPGEVHLLFGKSAALKR